MIRYNALAAAPYVPGRSADDTCIVPCEEGNVVDYSCTTCTCRGQEKVSNGRSRHTFQTKMAIILSVSMLTVIGLMSVFFSGFGHDPFDTEMSADLHWHRQDKELPDGAVLDFASSSCGEIFTATSPDEPEVRCTFGRTCNDGDGIFLPFIFCHTTVLSTEAWCLLLFPFVTLWLVLLFRMLGSTAEDFFSPSLEMFSLKMGLPPRFAAVSLLALGNGAPDVSATINAIAADPYTGYKLILGALTGAGMFVGTIVAGSIILVTDGIQCRGALVRDVLVYALALYAVYLELQTGSIGKRAVGIFFGIYCAYVGIVFAADMYHRVVHVPGMEKEPEIDKLDRMAAPWGASAGDATGNDAFVSAGGTGNEPLALSSTESGSDIEETTMNEVQSNELSPLTNGIRRSKGIDGINGTNLRSTVSSLIQSFSNYGPESFRIDNPIKLHGPDGILTDHDHHGIHIHNIHDSVRPHSISMQNLDDIDDITDEDTQIEDLYSERNLGIVIHEGFHELREHLNDLIDDIFENEEIGMLDKVLLACELPFTILRKLTVSIPCEGYFCRPLVALSIALSPVWMAVYLSANFDVNMIEGWRFYLALSFAIFLGALVLRYADDDILPLGVLIPTALYGFIVAATWIDFIGAHLVHLLEFLGALCRIPNAVMGLTVLAWGNSMGDLSTNVTMARKGLPNMAITACFAGPCFTLLCGLGSGFASLLNSGTQLSTVPVSVPPSVKTGFCFLICNCVLFIVSGLSFYKGTITKVHSYFMFSLYGCYLATCVALQFL